MFKTVTALFAALIAACLVVGSPTSASAHTSYVYRTVHVYKNVWHVHNVWRTRYVRHIHRVVHVTLVRPIIHVHDVKRIHYRTVAIVRRVNIWETRRLPARYIVTHSVVHVWHHHWGHGGW